MLLPIISSREAIGASACQYHDRAPMPPVSRSVAECVVAVAVAVEEAVLAVEEEERGEGESAARLTRWWWPWWCRKTKGVGVFPHFGSFPMAT